MTTKVSAYPALVAAAALCFALFLSSCAESAAQSSSTESKTPEALQGVSDTASNQTEDSLTAEKEPLIIDARLFSLVVDHAEPTDEMLTTLATNTQDYTKNVEAELQYPEYPSGCEIIALNMALRALGFDLSKTEIADNYLNVNGSEWGYLASPFETNGGGFPPGIVDAANSYLAAQGSSLTAHDLTGSSSDALEALVDAGVPVCVWTTLSLTPPDYDPELGGTDTWFINEHCVLLFAYNDSSVTVANPLEGIQEQDRALFAQIYEQCGNYALAIW